ncbi:N-acetyltransferase 8 isoform X1 [Saccopteryx leptura]|uniref:N-acetyltransferase 8 isoform X1 n=2 Tax=Saccopteryx leptura TaxID=249018 RepID=UPI00339C658D
MAAKAGGAGSGRGVLGSRRGGRPRAARKVCREPSSVDLEIQTHKSSMAPYHIRKYQESDRQRVLDLFSKGMFEHVPTTFRHILKLPQTVVVLLGGALALFLVSGSWVLALVAGLTLLAALRLLAKYPWTQYVAYSLQTDMSDITKSYCSKPGSCFWVAESGGQVVGTVGARPVEEPTLQKKQLELLHLSVALEHRGQGIAKALVRTLLQFARDQGYSEVVLSTSMLQHSALALYQHMGFQKTGQHFFSITGRLVAISVFQLTYWLPAAQAPQLTGAL